MFDARHYRLIKKADFTPSINADSLTKILLTEFVTEFNKDATNYNKLLKKNNTYLAIGLSIMVLPLKYRFHRKR